MAAIGKIINLTAPSEAATGSGVMVKVVVQNTGDESGYFSVDVPTSPNVGTGRVNETLAAGQSKTYYWNFFMPDSYLTITAKIRIGQVEHDRVSVVVALIGVPPPEPPPEPPPPEPEPIKPGCAVVSVNVPTQLAEGNDIPIYVTMRNVTNVNARIWAMAYDFGDPVMPTWAGPVNVDTIPGQEVSVELRSTSNPDIWSKMPAKDFNLLITGGTFWNYAGIPEWEEHRTISITEPPVPPAPPIPPEPSKPIPVLPIILGAAVGAILLIKK